MSSFQDSLIALAARQRKFEPLLELYDMVGEEQFKKIMFVFAGQRVSFPSQEVMKKLLARDKSLKDVYYK